MVLIVCDFLAGKGVDAIFQFFGKADNFERCIQMVSKRAPKAKGMIFKTTTKYCHALHQTKSVKCKTSPGSLTCLFAGNWFLNMHFKDVQTFLGHLQITFYYPISVLMNGHNSIAITECTQDEDCSWGNICKNGMCKGKFEE